MLGEVPTGPEGMPRRVWEVRLPFATHWKKGSRLQPKQVGHLSGGWPWAPHDRASLFFFPQDWCRVEKSPGAQELSCRLQGLEGVVPGTRQRKSVGEGLLHHFNGFR